MYRKVIYEDYVRNQDLDKKRKEMWESNKELKNKLNFVYRDLAKKGIIDSNSQFSDTHKYMMEQPKISKPFYKELYLKDKDLV